MNALIIIFNIILILVSIALIAVVLMQQGQRQGLGAIAGGAETFLGKNASKGLNAKLAKITKLCALVFIVLAIATTIIVSHNNDYDPHAHSAYLIGDSIYYEDGTIVPLTEATEDQLHAVGMHGEDVQPYLDALAEAEAAAAAEAEAAEAVEAEIAAETTETEAAETEAAEAVETEAAEATETEAAETTEETTAE